MVETDKEVVKGYSFRLEESIMNEIDHIAEVEEEKTGLKVDRSNMVRKILKDYIKSYKHN